MSTFLQTQSLWAFGRYWLIRPGVFRVAPRDIDTPLKKLGEVPMAALRDTVLALDEDAWRD